MGAYCSSFSGPRKISGLSLSDSSSLYAKSRDKMFGESVKACDAISRILQCRHVNRIFAFVVGSGCMLLMTFMDIIKIISVAVEKGEVIQLVTTFYQQFIKLSTSNIDVNTNMNYFH